MAKNDVATKAAVKGLRDELKGDLKTLRDELTEVIRDTETKLLKAFYGFAESTQKRLNEGERANFPHAP